jgi:hypothetical protein
MHSLTLKLFVYKVGVVIYTFETIATLNKHEFSLSLHKTFVLMCMCVCVCVSLSLSLSVCTCDGVAHGLL